MKLITAGVLLCASSNAAFAPHVFKQPRASLQLAGSALARSDQKKDLLPPPPEDQLVMSGDVFALFVYTFMDHSMNEMYIDMARSGHVDHARTLDPLGELANSQIPVWFDQIHSTMTPDHLLTLISTANFNYSPSLSTAGLASVVMTTCWLFSGWINQAFIFKNTLECNTARMLWITGKTWIMSCALVVAIALAGDAACDCLRTPSLGGLTKADAYFIFDSLTVLISWRFMVSAMLGGWRK